MARVCRASKYTLIVSYQFSLLYNIFSHIFFIEIEYLLVRNRRLYIAKKAVNGISQDLKRSFSRK